jgi:hypothetical protein
MLDVHILVLPGRDEAIVGRCVESVMNAADQAGYPVDVHLLCGIEGHIGRGRVLGYAKGHHPYVTSVDDDDWVDSNAFACLAQALLYRPASIYTRSIGHNAEGAHIQNIRQNFRVFRRDVTESIDLSLWPACDSSALIAHADDVGEIRLLDACPYHHVMNDDSSARLILKSHPSIVSRARSLGAVHRWREMVA